MEQPGERKFSKFSSRLPDLRSSGIFRRSSTLSLPTDLAIVAESEEEGATQVVASDMMNPLPPWKSRLQRLSSLLSPLRTDSKDPKDVRSSTLRKPMPASRTQHAKPVVDLRPDPQPLSVQLPTFPSQEHSASASPSNRRSLELPNGPKVLPTPPATGHHRNMSADRQGRRRDSASLSPAQIGHNRAVSTPITARPRTSGSSGEEEKVAKITKRRSGFGLLKPSSRGSSPSRRGRLPEYPAWIVDNVAGVLNYDMFPMLLSGEKVADLWDEKNGNVLVYLFDPESGRGPSFKLPEHLFGCSKQLSRLIALSSGRPDPGSYNGQLEDKVGNMQISGFGTPPYTPEVSPNGDVLSAHESPTSFTAESGDIHLYFPSGLSTNGPVLPPHDVQTLVDIRNLFAFLEGRQLVETPERPSSFHALVTVATILRRLNFTNLTGDTFGEVAAAAFAQYLDFEGIPDIRHSPENTIRALVLAERMKDAGLYNEAFPHAVGKYADIREVEPKLFNLISRTTQSRLERAHFELTHRQRSANERLSTFGFPSLFAGIASSKSRPESKYISKSWNTNFVAMRTAVLSYYRSLHGQWPPKASSKKNSFVEGGLNRLVLKGLYGDLCGLYDFLVDRKAFTTRGMDASDDQDTSNISPSLAALRGLLGEYDRSSPPVQPPVPFDVPLIPTFESLNPRFPMLSAKEQLHASTRKLPYHEAILILTKSHNQYPKEQTTPFLEMFKAFEEKEAHGKSVQELADQRIGHWIFLYAVIQALPMLVIDAPDVKFTEGVEYFLCQPPWGNYPWKEDAAPVKKEWYGISKTGGLVSLPSDVVNNGVEAVYRRSHCWTVANAWLAGSEYSISMSSNHVDDGAAVPTSSKALMSPLEPPPGFGGSEFTVALSPGPVTGFLQRSAESLPALSNTLSPVEGRRRQDHRRSIAIGLERLPIPTDVSGDESWGPFERTPVSARGTSPMGMGQRTPVSAHGTNSMGLDQMATDEPRRPSSAIPQNQTFDAILTNL